MGGAHASIAEVRAPISDGAFIHAENVTLAWTSLEVRTYEQFSAFPQKVTRCSLTTCSPLSRLLVEHSRALSLDEVCSLLVLSCVEA